jgi:hypothetical protein
VGCTPSGEMLLDGGLNSSLWMPQRALAKI